MKQPAIQVLQQTGKQTFIGKCKVTKTIIETYAGSRDSLDKEQYALARLPRQESRQEIPLELGLDVHLTDF